MTPREKKLKAALDSLLSAYGPGYLRTDPLQFPRHYERPEDREVAALFCALFAYGNVKAMGAFLGAVLKRLGDRPAAGLLRGPQTSGWPGYRFQTGEEVGRFLAGAGAVLRDFGSLEACFSSGEGDVRDRLEAFAGILRERCGDGTPGILHLLPLPSAGSACKRWWLFLRWVCRPDDGLDLGLWDCPRPADLLLPVDTHVARIAYALGLSRRKSADWKFAQEATATLRRLDPGDPVRYDFALARLGITGQCPCEPGDPLSARCPLRPHCRRKT